MGSFGGAFQGAGFSGSPDATVVIEAILRDKASIALRNIGSKMVTFGNNLVNLGSRIRSAGQSLTIGLTVPIIAFGAAMFNAFVGFDDEMAKVSAFTNASIEDVARWRDEILKMAPDLAIAPKALAEGLFFVASAGLEIEDVIPTLRAIGMAAGAGLGEVGDLARIATGAMNAYRLENVTGAEVMGVLIAAVREGNAETDDLAQSLPRLMDNASNLNIGLRDLTGTVAGLTLGGNDASTATTFLLGIFRSFMKTSPQLDDALGEINLTWEEMREILAEKGLMGTLKELNDRIGDNDRLWGKLFPRMRGISGISTLLGDSFEHIDELIGRVSTATEQDLIVAFEETETVGREFRRAMVELNIQLIELGSVVIPIIGAALPPLISRIKAVVAWFTELSPRTQQVIIVIVALAAVLGPLLIVIGALIAAAGVIIGAIGGLGLVLGILLGPVGLVILALIALVVIGILVWKNWDTITESVGNAIDALMGLPVVGPIIERMLGVIGRIKEVAEDVISFFRNVFRGEWSAAWQDIKDVAIGLLTLFLDWLTFGFGPEVLAFFRQLPGRIVGTMGNLSGKLIGKGQQLSQGLWQGIADAGARVVRWARNLGGQIVSLIGNVTRVLYQKGRDIIQGLIDGILSMVPSIPNPFDLIPGGGFSIPNPFDLFGLEHGTNFVPRDMLALLHKGEIVIPARFADTIRVGSVGPDTLTSFNSLRGGSLLDDDDPLHRRGITQHITVNVEERSPSAVSHAVQMAGIKLGQQLVDEGV